MLVISDWEAEAEAEEFKASLGYVRLCHQTKQKKECRLGLVGKTWSKVQGQSGQVRDSVSK